MFAVLVPAYAQRYVEITADIETTTYKTGNSSNAAIAANKKFSVVCIVGGNEWRIESDFAEDVEEKWLFDGTNVYDSIRPTKETPQKLADKVSSEFGLATMPFELVKSNLTIHITATPGGLPLGNEGVNIPWLAFCSGTYLKRNGRLIPLPVVASLRQSPGGFAYSDKTQTFDDELGLPRTIDLLTSESLYQKSVSNFNKENYFASGAEKATQRKTTFADGILKFHYAVIESTNFLGWNLPLRFEYHQNQPNEDGKWEPRYRGLGQVSSIKAAKKPDGIFASNMKQTIVDYRFRYAPKHIDALVYASTNDFVQPTNAPGLQNRFATRMARATLPPPFLDSRVRWVILAIFFLSAAIPLTIKFIRKKH